MEVQTAGEGSPDGPPSLHFRASELPPLDRRPAAQELQRAVDIADRLGLRRRAA